MWLQYNLNERSIFKIFISNGTQVEFHKKLKDIIDGTSDEKYLSIDTNKYSQADIEEYNGENSIYREGDDIIICIRSDIALLKHRVPVWLFLRTINFN